MILQDNKLSSTIPTTFGQLGKLQALSLGSNKLTGIIPSEIGRLLGLGESEYLYFLGSHCKFNLTVIFVTTTVTLSLYDNDLTGTIPVELERLVNLNSLYLDNTLLEPTIPTGMCDLGALKDFWADCDELGGCDCCTTCCIDDVVCL